MKRILLSFFMLAMGTFAFAQQNGGNSPAAFEAKVVLLNNALTQNNAELGHTILNQLTTMMQAQMAITKAGIANAQTQAEKDAGYLNVRKQFTAYNHCLTLANDNIITHAVEIHTELESFETTY